MTLTDEATKYTPLASFRRGDAPPSSLAGGLWLLRDMRRATGRRLWVALVFLVMGSLSEGLSLVLLLPILQLAANGDGSFAVDLSGRELAGIALPSITVTLEALLLTLILLVVLQSVFNRVKSVYLSDVLQDFLISARSGLFDSIAHAKWEAVSRLRRSELEQALTGEIERISAASFVVLNLMQVSIVLIMYLGISLVLSWPLTLLALGFGLFTLFVMRPYRRLATEFGTKVQESRTDQFRIVSEFLSGLRTARSMNAEPQHVASFNAELARMKQDTGAYARQSATGGGLFQVIMTAGGALFIYVSLRLVQMPLSEIIVLLLILMRLSPRIMMLQTNAQQLLVDLPACRRLAQLRRRLESDADETATTEAEAVAVPRRTVELANVSYRYPSAGQEGEAARAENPVALDACSLTIEVGKVTALIGPSGSGKSTLADILLGLIRPQSGQFLLDGVALTPAQLRGWRAHLAYVPQDPVLMHDTIRANLLSGAPGADDDAIQRALELAAASEFVARLPEGLETTVGDRGGLLSGGERQRLALARAFLRNPSVLILDEATSALDWQSQNQVAASLAALPDDVTVVMIAHRPSLVRFADRVYSLEQGHVVEAGSPAELLRDPISRLARMLGSEAPAA